MILESGLIVAVAVFIGLLLATVPISLLVEAMRPTPVTPQRVGWAPEVPVQYSDLNGTRVRYVAVGSGHPVVLLHTLRTQLDMFQKVIPELARRFRVVALDYPGHGWSDIPDADYTVEFFVASVARFLERMKIENAVIAGESIGGTIGLLLASQHNPRVRAVVAINPYDYDRGAGLRRSSALANLLFRLTDVPVLGATVMRLRQFPIEKRIFEGGVHRRESLPPALAREMYEVGGRRGHYRAFMSLLRHARGWELGRREYGKIDVPVLLIYGAGDWSRPEEREAAGRAIPGAQVRVIENAGHFLSLDAPNELVRAITDLSTAAATQRGPQF